MGGDVFVPDDLQRDVLAFQLAVNRRPVRRCVKPMTALAPRFSVSLTVEGARPRRLAISRVANPAENFRRTIWPASRMGTLSAGIVCSLGIAKGADLFRPAAALATLPYLGVGSFRYGGRLYLVLVGDFAKNRQPDVFDRVQLGSARGQEDRRDVLGDIEIAGRVPSGSVEEQDGVGALGDTARDGAATIAEYGPRKRSPIADRRR